MSDSFAAIEILGPKLFEQDAQGRLRSGVGTLFPRHRVLVTLPSIHAAQRLAFIEHLNQQRLQRGEPPLPAEEQGREMAWSVDLFFEPARGPEPARILIRPDPDSLTLAFEGDDLLQELVSKRQIKFLFVSNPKVQQKMKERGECWRISPLPRSPEEMNKLITDSKAAIREQPIYFYSRVSGTRYLTFQEFAGLERLEAAALAWQLQEIAEHSLCRNRLGNPELDFFAADHERFGARNLAGARFAELPEPDLRARHRQLMEAFRDAMSAEFRADDVHAESWRNRMFAALVSLPKETVAEETLRGLSPEFFQQIEWLPGGRFEEGEFIFDSIFAEADAQPHDAQLQALIDPKARGFIFSFIREYVDLEYVNVGHIVHSMSKRRPLTDGRRDVYIAELKLRSAPAPVVRFIRMLKWGVRERLDEGKDLLQSILETEEYVDWLLDRRLGCRQLGMNLPSRIVIRRINEIYTGRRAEMRGKSIRAIYSERDYLRGVATDKLAPWKYSLPDYAVRLARLLGKAAASNIIVGRTYDEGLTVIFDDGDEVVIEGPDGLPEAVVVGDHSGAFGEFLRPLAEFAKAYAQPVNERVEQLPNPREFAETYLAAFREQFLHVQGDYRKRRRAFDTLFKHCKYDQAGSFAYRWECVLRRLDQTNADALLETIRNHISVLNSGKTS